MLFSLAIGYSIELLQKFEYYMTQYFNMHSDNPQPRLIAQAAERILAGDLIVYPTDSSYAFGCALTSKVPLAQMRKLRGITDKHPLTLVCHSISQAANFAIIHDQAFQFMRDNTPGAYTFILKAKNNVPRPVQGVKRKIVGIRIPNNPTALKLVQALKEPILSTTCWLNGEPEPCCDPHWIVKQAFGQIGLVLDDGLGDNTPTTVIDFTADEPVLVRQGKAPFLGNEQ